MGKPEFDLAITLPSHIEWADYEKELAAVRDGQQELLFKVAYLPKFTGPERSCYLIWRGMVRGRQMITDLRQDFNFECTTAGKKWKGNFVVRSGRFERVDPMPCRGFRGFRYVNGLKQVEASNGKELNFISTAEIKRRFVK